MDTEFGWLPIRHDYSGARFRIETSPTFDDAFSSVIRSDNVDEDWFWPPLETESPPRPVSVYALPATHVIEVDGEQTEATRLAEFLVTMLGFLYGILLTPGGWVNFYRVCIKPSRFLDFYIQTTACARILRVAEQTWLSVSPATREALFGAIRWHTFALSYDRPFERFLMQYVVLDAAWHAHRLLNPSAPQAKSHANRIEALCRHYDLDLPAWWKQSGSVPAVVTIRNELVHEARWGGEPLGFGHPKAPLERIHLELVYFNARILMRLAGEDHKYVHSSMGRAGRQMIR